MRLACSASYLQRRQQKVPRVSAGLRLALALAVTRTTTGAVRTLDLLAKARYARSRH